MKAYRWIIASLILGVSSTLFAAQSDRVTISHYETLQRLSIQTVNSEVIGPAVVESDNEPLRQPGAGRVRRREASRKALIVPDRLDGRIVAGIAVRKAIGVTRLS